MHIADCIELYMAHHEPVKKKVKAAFTTQLEQTQERQLSAGGPGSGRHPGFSQVRSAIKQKGLTEDKGKFQNTTTGQGGGGRRYHYDVPGGGFYKVTHKVDETGSPKEVGTWMYQGPAGRAKGTDGQSFLQHLSER